MRVLFVNNDGGGFADHLDVSDGISVEQFFKERMPHATPSDYLIRVNRQPVDRGQVLREGDRISITPVKIEGAR